MKIDVFLGIDIGGTGVKAGVFDETGHLLAICCERYFPVLNSLGHSEIAIEEIYEAVKKTVRNAVCNSGAKVLALAVSSQGQTFTSFDSEYKPLHPAIMWYDSRASEESEFLKNSFGSIERKGAIPVIESISTAPKILWLKKNQPEMMSKARYFMLLPDYIAYKFTGRFVIDPSTAATTGLYADDAQDYSEDLLSILDIDKSSVASILASGLPIGKILPEVAEDLGIDSDALLVAGTNDQYAGAIGAGNCRPGIVSETTGTCMALVALTEKLPDNMPDGLTGGRFPIMRYQFALAYAKTAGLVIDWFRRELCNDKTFDELESAASDVPIGSNGVIVIPHFDGEISPVPNPKARGCICNLTLANNSDDIYRAILESISFNLRENIELLRSNGFKVETIRSIGGGSKSDLWCQIKADVTGITVEKSEVTEAATLGAAMLAAVGNGNFRSIDECASLFYKSGRIFEPDADRNLKYQPVYNLYKKLCRDMYQISE